MNIGELMVTVILVSASGVLAPGPLFFANLLQGTRGGAKVGLACSTGHLLFEFPLVLVLGLGLLTVAEHPGIRTVVGIAGGLALLGFAGLQLRDVRRASTPASVEQTKAPSGHALVVGLLLTALNPFFILWWLSVGAKLVADALVFASLAGVVVMYASHIWMDYAWLTATAHLAKRGRMLLGSKAHRVLLAAFAVVLLYFGASFLWSALSA